jgi:hypothetical protein
MDASTCKMSLGGTLRKNCSEMPFERYFMVLRHPKRCKVKLGGEKD